MQVAEGIERMTQGAANFYVVHDGDSAILIDAGTPSDWYQTLQYLARLRLTIGDVDAILLTHGHADHTGFAERAQSKAMLRFGSIRMMRALLAE